MAWFLVNFLTICYINRNCLSNRKRGNMYLVKVCIKEESSTHKNPMVRWITNSAHHQGFYFIISRVNSPPSYSRDELLPLSNCVTFIKLILTLDRLTLQLHCHSFGRVMMVDEKSARAPETYSTTNERSKEDVERSALNHAGSLWTHLMTEVDPSQATAPLAAFCFMTGFMSVCYL